MMTRRVFLKNGSAALVSLGFTPVFIARAAQAAQARKKILVAIFQRGAVDGLNMVVPFGETAYYANRPSIAIPQPGASGRRARSRRLLRPASAHGAAAARTSRTATSPSSMRAARLTTRGRTSTRRTTWRAARRAEEHARRLDEPLPAREGPRGTLLAVPRRRADAGAAAHAAGHGAGARDRPARPVRHPRRQGRRRDDVSGFESQYAKAADADARRHGPRGVRCREDAEGRESRRLHARQRRRVPAHGLRRSDAPDRADHQSRSRPRSRIRRTRQLGSPRQRRSSTGQIANRLDEFASGLARVRPRPGRSHGRRRGRDDVGVRPDGEGKRQPRHRPRPRQRHARSSAATSRAARSTASGRASIATSSTKAATWRSPPTSATSSPNASRATWAHGTSRRSSRDTVTRRSSD